MAVGEQTHSRTYFYDQSITHNNGEHKQNNSSTYFYDQSSIDYDFNWTGVVRSIVFNIMILTIKYMTARIIKTCILLGQLFLDYAPTILLKNTPRKQF